MNVQPAAGHAEVAGLVAVKDPSAFRRTVKNACALLRYFAVIWNAFGSTSLSNTPGAGDLMTVCTLLAKLSLLATGPVPTVLDWVKVIVPLTVAEPFTLNV